MPRLILVRHGRAAASFAEAMDPGLDATGQAQAEAVAGRWGERPPIDILTSPLQRTRETAAPLAARWRRTPRVEPRIAEIPSPGMGLEERALWLRGLMQGRWHDLDPAVLAWRNQVVEALLAQPADAIAFSHFVAINVAVGAAMADDRVVVFHPDNCSETVLESAGGRLRVVSLGLEAATRIG